MRILETPEETAARCAGEIISSLRRARRTYLRYGHTFGPVRITIAARDAPETLDDADDLPDALRVARPATRQVYRALRALRADLDPDATVLPTVIVQRLDATDADTVHSVDTVNHALADLRARRLAWWHPTRRWVLGCERPSLPISAGQTGHPPAAELRDYTSRMAGAGVRRFNGGSSMKRIWVPGERTEYGVVIADADTEHAVACRERIGEMRVPTRSGRLATVPAVRCELVRVDGGRALVKLPDGSRLTVRVLGDWQLAGLTEPAEVESLA